MVVVSPHYDNPSQHFDNGTEIDSSLKYDTKQSILTVNMMNGSKKILSVLVILMMIVPTAGVFQTDIFGQLQADDSGTDIQWVDSDGTTIVCPDVLAEVFGLNPNPSSITDPLNSTVVGMSPMEFVSSEGSDSIRVSEIGAEVGSYSLGDWDSNMDDFTSIAVQFSAHLDADSDTDWYCSIITNIYYGSAHINAMNLETGKCIWRSMTDKGPLGFQEGYDRNWLESTDIYPYAVGDFLGKGCDQIAVLIWHELWILWYDPEFGDLFNEKIMDITTGEWDSASEVGTCPVSMIATDIDFDGRSDIVMAIEDYSNSVGSTTITAFSFPYVDPIYVQKVNMRTIDLNVQDPKTSNVIKSTMTSIAAGDIDNDGTPELVIGGYLWDPNHTDSSYTSNWSYGAGELYLSYMEMSDLSAGNLNLKGITVLGDDDGSARTRMKDVSDWNKYYDLDDHNLYDTSIYLDSGDISRSPNWLNWTIPMAAGSLSGYVNGRTCDQVYFDLNVYSFNGSNFVVYYEPTGLTQVPDNNNVVCQSIKFGLFTQQDPLDFEGRAELFIGYAADLNKHFDDGDVEVSCLIVYDTDMNGNYTTKYGKDFSNPIRWIREYDNDYYNSVFVGNFDHDTYYAQYQSHMYTYTDPTVLAVLSAIPYDKDLASLLSKGSESIGSTGFTKSISKETESSEAISFEFGGSVEMGKLLGLIKTEASAGYKNESEWSDSHMVSYEVSFKSSHNSVAVYTVPVDIYFYKLLIPEEDGSITITNQAVPFFNKPVLTILAQETYEELVEEYNETMREYLGDDFEEIPVIDFAQVTEGDLSTYTYTPSDPLVKPVSVYYRESGEGGEVEQAIEIEDATGCEVTNGYYGNFEASVWKIGVEIGGDQT